MMTLEEFLDLNCHYVETAALKVASGQDLAPLFSYLREDGGFVFGTITAGFVDNPAKDLTMAWCRARLRAERARMYALISAAWVVQRRDPAEAAEVERVIGAEGSGTRYRDERRECYLVSVGDHERSLLVTLDVQRDYKQKIRKLVRGPVSQGGDLGGRMVNLLLDPQVRQ
jgi:hypothetical protein